jgi:putative addiction module component (TIGR02574 family)
MAELQTRLLEEALELTEEDRAKLAGLLLDSLDAEKGEGVEAAWVSEIKTRLTALDEGQTEAIPWEEAKKQLLNKLNARNDHTSSSRGAKGS